MKLILLFGVYLSLPSISQGSLRGPAQYIDAEEFRFPSSTNEIANYVFQSEGGNHHKTHQKGLEVIVGKNCSSFRVTFKNKDDRQEQIHLPDNELCRGHIIDQSKTGKCDSNSYPITCKFDTIDETNKIDKQKLKNYFPISAKSVEKSISFHEELDIEERTRRGKRDKQVKWVGKAAKKIGAAQVEKACAPRYRGKDPPRNVDCDMCWKWFVPYPCNCNCRGWTDIPGLPGMCAQPCHEHPGYSVDTGFYCWKHCDRPGQLALPTGCGFTPIDRTCVESTEECVKKVANIVLSITEILSFFVTGPVAGAFKNAAKQALKKGSKTAIKNGLRQAAKMAAKEMAKELAKNKVIKKELAKLGTNARKQVLEQGSEFFLVASMGSDPDYGDMALDVAEALDPSGVVGLVRQFIPPEDCDDMIYMEPFPDEEPGLPDLDPLHALDDDAVGISVGV